MISFTDRSGWGVAQRPKREDFWPLGEPRKKKRTGTKTFSIGSQIVLERGGRLSRLTNPGDAGMCFREQKKGKERWVWKRVGRKLFTRHGWGGGGKPGRGRILSFKESLLIVNRGEGGTPIDEMQESLGERERRSFWGDNQQLPTIIGTPLRGIRTPGGGRGSNVWKRSE